MVFVRCYSHWLNLPVKEAIKEDKETIHKVHVIVRKLSYYILAVLLRHFFT